MALMSLVFLPFAVIIVQKLKPRLFSLSNDVAKSNADIAHFLFESLSNTAVIRAFGAEKTESDKLKDKQAAVLTFLLKYQVLGAVSGSVSTAFGIVNSLIVFGYGGWQVLEGQLTVGSLVAFSVYQGRVFGPLQALLDGVLALQKSKVAIKRVREILDIPPCFDETGDKILLTKSIAVEGTAIIAREFESRLRTMGFNESDLIVCQQLLASISILAGAAVALEIGGVSAMHDVTEGGLATALEELSIAGGFRIKIDMDTIPVFTETRKVCRLLGINPLGLIGSGSLLICCQQNGCESLMSAIHRAGIEVTCIGEVLEKGRGIVALKKSQPALWPQFEVDEITRLF